jgi:hypothetical protein
MGQCRHIYQVFFPEGFLARKLRFSRGIPNKQTNNQVTRQGEFATGCSEKHTYLGTGTRSVDLRKQVKADSFL